MSYGDARDIGRAASNALAGNWGAVIGDAVQEAKKGKNGLLRSLLPSSIGGSPVAAGAAAGFAMAAIDVAQEQIGSATQSFAGGHRVAQALRSMPGGTKAKMVDMDALISSNMATRGYLDRHLDTRAAVTKTIDALTLGLVGNAAAALDLLGESVIGKSGAKKIWDSWKKSSVEEKADASEKILKDIKQSEEHFAAAAKAEAVFNVKEAQKQLRKANAALPEKYQFWYDPEKRIMAQEGARIASRQFARSMMSRGSDRTGD
jgi:hypothetical protein